MELVPIRKTPFSIHTLYKWHAQNRHPGLILKVGGRLHMDMTEWRRMAERERDKQIAESKRVHSGINKAT
jgi:hypothetical protein